MGSQYRLICSRVRAEREVQPRSWTSRWRETRCAKVGRGQIRRGLGNGLGVVDEVEAEAMGGVGGEIDKEAVLGDV